VTVAVQTSFKRLEVVCENNTSAKQDRVRKEASSRVNFSKCFSVEPKYRSRCTDEVKSWMIPGSKLAMKKVISLHTNHNVPGAAQIPAG
jgi:hypothetical protein